MSDKAKNENERLFHMLAYEREFNEKGYTLIAGIDEAGRGPLCGPVVAAAVILPIGLVIEGVNDSKKLSEKKRELLYDEIIHSATAVGVGSCEHEEIDEINILNATKKAMRKAVDSLHCKPDVLFVDAVKLESDIHCFPLIKGDALSLSIAAASIIAKVTRDRIMREYALLYPQYHFEKHKGYGTKVHYAAIKEHGISPIHRKTFTKGWW